MSFREQENIEFENVLVLKVSEKALKCEIDGDIHWMPISQIIKAESDLTDRSEAGDEGTLVVTEWIATEKGLI